MYYQLRVYLWKAGPDAAWHPTRKNASWRTWTRSRICSWRGSGSARNSAAVSMAVTGSFGVRLAVATSLEGNPVWVTGDEAAVIAVALDSYYDTVVQSAAVASVFPLETESALHRVAEESIPVHEMVGLPGCGCLCLCLVLFPCLCPCPCPCPCPCS